MCLPCLAARTGLVPGAARARIQHLASIVVVRDYEAPCQACNTTTMTYGVQ